MNYGHNNCCITFIIIITIIVIIYIIKASLSFKKIISPFLRTSAPSLIYPKSLGLTLPSDLVLILEDLISLSVLSICSFCIAC